MMLNRVSLNTIGLNRIGLNRIGKPSRGSSDRPYIDPEVLASLKAVCICYGKSNEDPDRAIIKNLVDPDNPFVISNAAFKLNSGFGKYEITFQYFPYIENVTNVSDSKVVFGIGGQLLIPYPAMTENIPSFKIKVSGLSGTYHFRYYYRDSNGAQDSINMAKDGIYELPICYNVQSSSDGTNCGFANNGNDVVTITQIPSFEGAFVTDGIDDLITSTKTVQEMLGGSNEITVVSMIHQIDGNVNYTNGYTNYIRHGGGFIRSVVAGANGKGFNKTGIYGYTSTNLNSSSMNLGNIVNNILGDKDDYSFERSSTYTLDDAKYSVQNFVNANNQPSNEGSSVAWYWTIIANKVLTTDQINQVIAYFNLDRTLKPDILCDVKKQGITNENHAEFGDKLIDYSGNGRDIQLNNIAWNKESGIDDDGALRLDGVNDFGKVTGMPIYKDYTAIVCREFISDKTAPILSKAKEPNNGAFVMEIIANPNLGNTALYSFGKDTPNIDIIQSKSISYQTKYIYNSKDIVPGNGVDSDTMWIGKLRDNHAWFANAAIYSLMTFPYSMSEFLIERQLKKYKLGTLYPDMVEFRPVIKSNVLLDAKPTFVIRGTSTYLNAGDYVPENSQIWVSIKMNNIADRITKFTVNGKTIDIPENAYSEVTLQYGFPFVIDKSPQKISITIEQDENYVLFNPTINSNAIFEVGNEQNMTELIAKVRNHEIDGFIMYLSKLESKYILPNSWINKDTEVISSIYCLDNILQDDLHINIDGNSKYCLYADSSNNISEFLIMDDNIFEEQYITNVLTANTIDIQLDQYIRYEDIVHPYPVLLRFNDENGNEVSWGGKFRVGSTITRIGSIDDPESNLLNGLYSINGLTLNGKNVTSSTHIVEKQMVFKTTATYLLDNNEPKVILSPRLLRIPNSSYKILGHIPDISGHGNHGVIHNSAYTEGSGVNEDGSWQFDGVDDFINIPTLSSGGKQVLMKVNWQSDYDVPGYMYDSNAGEYRNYIAKGNKEQIAYENASKTYIDGILNANLTSADLKDITHNITSQFNNASGIPYIGCRYSLENFLKMSLYDFMLFDNISTDDKIKELNEYVGIEAKVELPPYYFDTHGKTNLDEDRDYIANLGTVKDVIEVSQPAIFAENWYDYYESFVSRSPIINKTDYSIEVKPTHMDSNFNMLLSVNCDTPLPAFRAKFTRTSNVDVSYAEIRYEYYVNGEWTYIDIFGEDNSAESVILDIPASEKSSISGSNADNFPNILIEVLPADNSVRYGLSNNNFAYDKMSGYGGYEFAKFDNELDWYLIPNNNHIDVVSRNGYEITLKNLSTGVNGWRFQNSTVKGFISHDIPFRIKANKSIRVYWDMHSYKISSGEAFGHVVSITTLNPNEDTSISLRHLTEEELVELDTNKDRMYYLLWFDLSTLAINEEVTIEMLPLYDGLVYDGVTDYSENINIPALTDYTYILKRQILKGIANSAVMYKGNITGNKGGAFICNYCEPSDTNLFTDFSFGGLLRSNDIDKPIIYGTKTSVNGDSITPGENIDTVGINVGKWVNYLPMVFYKLILYPKTIPLLQINFLKNLMERDEIIDLNNPIFIQE